MHWRWQVTETIDKVVEAVRADLLRRSELGIKKYGTTLSDGGYSYRQYLQHAYEEALDLSNYLKGAIMVLDGELNAEPTKDPLS